MKHIGTLPRFAAEVLAEEIGDIRLVVDNQDAVAHAAVLVVAACGPRGRRGGGVRAARRADGKFGESADPAVDRDRAAVLLGDDVIADPQAKPGAFAGG